MKDQFRSFIITLALIALVYLCLSCGVSLKTGRHLMIVHDKTVSTAETVGIEYEYRVTDGKRFVIFRSTTHFYFGDTLYIRRRY